MTRKKLLRHTSDKWKTKLFNEIHFDTLKIIVDTTADYKGIILYFLNWLN